VTVLSRLFGTRWRHVIILLPLGAAVGLVMGIVFRDLWFGLGVGALLGALFGFLLAIRNPRPL